MLLRNLSVALGLGGCFPWRAGTCQMCFWLLHQCICQGGRPSASLELSCQILASGGQLEHQRLFCRMLRGG